MGGQHHVSGFERYILYALAFSVLCVSPLVFIVLLNGILVEQPGYHWYERLSLLSRCFLAFLIFSSISAYAAACFVGGVFEALRRKREVMEERRTALARYKGAGQSLLQGENTSLAPLMEPPGVVPPDMT